MNLPGKKPYSHYLTAFLMQLLRNRSTTGVRALKSRVLVLDLINIILTGNARIAEYDGLRMLLEDELCKTLIQNATKPVMAIAELSATMQVRQTRSTADLESYH